MFWVYLHVLIDRNKFCDFSIASFGKETPSTRGLALSKVFPLHEIDLFDKEAAADHDPSQHRYIRPPATQHIIHNIVALNCRVCGDATRQLMGPIFA